MTNSYSVSYSSPLMNSGWDQPSQPDRLKPLSDLKEAIIQLWLAKYLVDDTRNAGDAARIPSKPIF